MLDVCTTDVPVIHSKVSSIKFNCFGKNLAVQSSCFHRIIDRLLSIESVSLMSKIFAQLLELIVP